MAYCKYTECPYYKNSEYFPIDLESHNSKVLLVFQAPGIDEWEGNNKELGRVPVSSIKTHSAGKRIMNSLIRIGKSRSDFDYVETVRCYPGKGKIGRDKKPRKKAISLCSAHLKNDISKHNYSTIICFGKIAQKAVKNIIGDDSNVRIINRKHPNSRLTNSKLDKTLENV